jgi:hypothetical protein
MHIFLETERLILRRFTTDDVDNLVELDSDPNVMFYVTVDDPPPGRRSRRRSCRPSATDCGNPPGARDMPPRARSPVPVLGRQVIPSFGPRTRRCGATWQGGWSTSGSARCAGSRRARRRCRASHRVPDQVEPFDPPRAEDLVTDGDQERYGHRSGLGAARCPAPRGVVSQDGSIGQALLLDDVGVILLGRAETVQKHQRDPGSVAAHDGDLDSDIADPQRETELLERVGADHQLSPNP